MSDSHWNIGDVVHDRDDDNPDPAIIVNTPDIPADGWEVPRFEKTIAEDNPDYPADAPIITVLFEDTLAHSFPDWKRDDPISYDTLDEVGVQHYSFPAPRLEPATTTESDAETHGDTSTTDEAHAAESKTETDTSPEDDSGQPSAAVRALEARLEDGGMTTEIDADGRTIHASKLGDTYRVRPGEVLDGDGPLRNRLEEIVDADDIQAST